MQITGVETLALSCPVPEAETWRFGGERRPPIRPVRAVNSDAVLVKLHPDEGTVGIGEP